MGTHHFIKYNTIENIYTKNPFRNPIAIFCGQENNELNGYAPVKQVEVSFNNILGCYCAFAIGVNNKSNSNVKPLKINVFNNNIVKCIKERNDDVKCLGCENSMIKDNEILEKDISLVIVETFEIKKYSENSDYIPLRKKLLSEDFQSVNYGSSEDEEKYDSSDEETEEEKENFTINIEIPDEQEDLLPDLPIVLSVKEEDLRLKRLMDKLDLFLDKMDLIFK